MNETIKAFIEENKEEQYREFSSKLIFTNYKIYGIRSKPIKDFSKKLVKDDMHPEEIKPECYEEILIRGYIINYAKRDFKEYRKLAHKHIRYMDNWATCDSFVSSAKWIKKNLDAYYSDILEYTKSEKEYYQRYGLVVLLSYYMDEKYIDDILNLLSNRDYHEYYYSLMAAAWLLSYCFMFHFEKTYEYVSNNKLHVFVYKKGIQKALESYRVSDDNKNLLRSLRNSLS